VSETVLLVVVLSIVPLVLIASTSFAKLGIVLAMLRNALGVGPVPDAAVLSVLAAVLSLYVMLPVGREMVRASAPLAARIDLSAPLAGDSGKAALEALSRASEPLRAFLDRNAGGGERALFLELGRRGLPAADQTSVGEQDLLVVLPAFFVTELKEAFEIGFLLLLPFLVLDLVIATILAALGMHALAPSTVALPFKLLLFLSLDGFRTLIDALVAGYV
jgi:type III secretion protein R